MLPHRSKLCVLARILSKGARPSQLGAITGVQARRPRRSAWALLSACCVLNSSAAPPSFHGRVLSLHLHAHPPHSMVRVHTTSSSGLTLDWALAQLRKSQQLQGSFGDAVAAVRRGGSGLGAPPGAASHLGVAPAAPECSSGGSLNCAVRRGRGGTWLMRGLMQCPRRRGFSSVSMPLVRPLPHRRRAAWGVGTRQGPATRLAAAAHRACRRPGFPPAFRKRSNSFSLAFPNPRCRPQPIRTRPPQQQQPAA